MKKLSAVLATACLALLAASPASSQSSEELMSYAVRGNVPPGYPASYAAIVRAGEDEGRLVIYSTTDADLVAPLIADFRAMYPRIDVAYEDLNSTELYHRFIAETKLGADTADILWSSAMDQQAALVSGGYAMTYVSPEKARFPAWANWKDQGFATTYEPVVFAYNKKLLPANEVPQTHADFTRLLNANPARFKGKVSSYNIEKSGLGFFLATQDAAISPEFWTLVAALGKAQARLDLTTSAMTRKLSSGETVLGYNLLGAYTAQKAASDDSLGYVFPRDYTLVMTRILIASKQAGHPNAAKLWIDYLLSKRGQTVLATASRLHAIRDDVEGENTAARLKQTLGASERPVAIGPALIGYLNNQNYRDFILQWKKALSGS
ncbi:ABC transporter substrate-binding protein [Bosea vaviloviae]|uniref:Iron ABC transporter substrate-binding protein n=1 Tax=Bosea vaviloviae TaxID=1526658 RepID=A0A1D7UCC0_9HYPH|nr:ABC transporter substrate-binding protein [Bosea vaviloviae]AOO85023.1 iron ABC transporter substrate-binding protein [Bosea vaviloviae]